MKFSTFEKYIFINSEINAVKTFINFSYQNNIEIVLHEETQNKYKYAFKCILMITSDYNVNAFGWLMA